MADNKQNKEQKDPNRKIVKINLNFTWIIYLLLIGGIFWMMASSRGANPQKVEWAEVEQMLKAGDVKEIRFVRNDYQGDITVWPDCLEKYKDKFGGTVPTKSPHFIFLVSSKFEPEVVFGAINSELPADRQFKVVMENDDKIWPQLLEWLFLLE